MLYICFIIYISSSNSNFPLPARNAWLLYFKRSYVRRVNGVFKGYKDYVLKRDVLPMTYPMADGYVQLQKQLKYNPFESRDFEIVCPLRDCPTRKRVRDMVKEYVETRNISKTSIVGQINQASRPTLDSKYFGMMGNAKIIVTANPTSWEGDFRLCEAFSGGALIFVDHMFVPRPYPFVNDEHIVYYDNMDKEDLFRKLDKYRSNLELMKSVAAKGYLHAMIHHRTVNLMDYVLRSVQFKLENLQIIQNPKNMGTFDDFIEPPVGSNRDHFVNTGYEMRNKALQLAKKLKAKRAR